MKKILMAMLLAVIFCWQNPAEAARSNIWQDDSYNLSSIQRFYLNPYMMNYAISKTSPAVKDISDSFSEIGMENKYFVVSDNDMQRFIKRDYKVDVLGKSDKEAAAAIEPYISQYADAYVVMTIVHNNRVVIFYEVYEANSNKMVYSYQVIAGGSDEDNLKTYDKLTKNFFNEFDRSAKAQAKHKK